MRDIDMIFILIALFNTNLSLGNIEKNNEQYAMIKSLQKEVAEISRKLDFLIHE